MTVVGDTMGLCAPDEYYDVNIGLCSRCSDACDKPEAEDICSSVCRGICAIWFSFIYSLHNMLTNLQFLYCICNSYLNMWDQMLGY